jgi:hypothetical protein
MTTRDASLEQKPYVMDVDADGFIQSLRPGDATNQIVFLGDSVLECLFLDPDRRFCSILQDRLTDIYGLPVRILNGGYSGATILHSLNVFLNKVIPLQPRAVVLMSGVVDVEVANKPASFWSRDCWFEPVIDTEVPNSARDTGNTGRHDFADRSRMLKIMATAADQFGIPLWLATVPHRQVYQGEFVERMYPDRAVFDAEVQQRVCMNRITRDFAMAESRPFFDLEGLLADRSEIFYDMFHLNQLGGRVVADSLMQCGFASLVGT